MKRMNNNLAEVRSILSALIPKVKSCKEALSDQSIVRSHGTYGTYDKSEGNAFHGMNGMSSDSEKVRAMLTILLHRVEAG
jgi:hypothetical protein